MTSNLRSNPLRRVRPTSRATLAASLAAVACAALLAACGGGGDAATTALSASPTATAQGAVGSYTEGTITGFGSVIVNGTRYDDSAATITDDGGVQRTAQHLKLGMRAEVVGGAVDATGSAKATAMRYGSRLVGPIGALDTAAGTVVVLGQTVQVQDATVFDSALATSLAGLAVGTVIEVHGSVDAAGLIAATRVEAPPTGLTSYKLRGTVASLNTTSATFEIGGATLNYASVAAASVPGTLADGAVVRVTLSTTPAADGSWTVTSFGRDAAGSLKPAATDHAHLRGTITAFTSSTSFAVDGTPVDASAATFPDGSTGVVLGAQVDVRGTLVDGTLKATAVSLESRHQRDGSRPYDVHGTVSALDTTARTFVVRGVTVSYAAGATWIGGTEASLVDGASVRVLGTVGATRSQLTATSIEFRR